MIGPLIGMLVSTAVPIVLAVVLLRRRRAGKMQTAGQSGLAGCLAVVRRGLLLAALPASLFCGLMVVSIGGVIHPPIVEVVTPWVCDGGNARLHTEDYSYKPGQRGTSMTFSCTDAQGQSRDITFKVLGAATLFYSAILAAILLPLAWWVGRFMRLSAAPGSMASPPRTHTPTVDGGPDDTLREVIHHLRHAPVSPARRGTADDALHGVIDNLRHAGITTVTLNGRQVRADPGMIDGLLHTLCGQARSGDIGGDSAHARTGQTVEGDIGERLLKLQALHRSGAISDADFEAKKAEILREL